MKTRPHSVTFEDVKAAVERLAGHAWDTPMVRSDAIDARVGIEVWFKPECTQKVGAFKYRGAFNRLSAMSEAERAKGVVAFSSGNHAQGVSRAAKELGMLATIVMPIDAPKIKVDGVKRDGAKIVLYDRHTESREEISAKISKDEGRIIVPSYDDPYIIAGQGTVGLEVAQEARERGIVLDALITAAGGGGLCAGISLALGALSPDTKIFAAEPTDYNDHQLSLRAGKRVGVTSRTPTLCDAIMTPMPGELTFPINKKSLTDVFTVTDDMCLDAMALVHNELGITVEPGGVVGLAAAMNGRFDAHPDIKTLCVVLSGGNVDPAILNRALEL